MKKSMTTFIVSTVLATVSLYAGPPPGWMRTYGGPSGDGGHWVEVTADTGFIICGATLIEPSGELGYVIKTDFYGNPRWTRTYLPYPDAIPNVDFNCIKQTPDSGYVVTGNHLVYKEHLSLDILVMKFDTAGLVVWSRTYGGEEDEDAQSMCLAPDGGYIVAGLKGSVVKREADMWIIRLDSLGDTLWTLVFGEEDSDWADCIAPTSDGNWIVSGLWNAQYTCLVKISDQGEVIWDNVYYTLDGRAKSVVETSDGGFVFTGQYMTSTTSSELYIARVDSQGNELWTKRYVDNPSLFHVGNCIEETPDGGFVLAAKKNWQVYGGEEGWLMRTDSLGDTLWTRTYIPNPDYRNRIVCVHQTYDGGYIMTGTTGWCDLPNGFDVWLVKTDSLGYVPIVEDQIEVESNIDTSAPLGRPVQIRYANMPGGFHAYVYDAAGRKVDELHNANASGTITWGEGQQSGVYFIKELSGGQTVRKVVLLR